MERLKNLISTKRAELKEDTDGSKKWSTQTELKHRENVRIEESQRISNAKRAAQERERLERLDEFFISSIKRKKKFNSNFQHINYDDDPGPLAEGGDVERSDAHHLLGGADHSKESVDNDDEAEPPISIDDIERRLRRLGEPIILFGERRMQRYRRLCQLEVALHEDDLMGGQQNSLLQVLGNRRRQRRNTEEYIDDDDDDDDDNDELSGTEAREDPAESNAIGASDPNPETTKGKHAGREEPDKAKKNASEATLLPTQLDNESKSCRGYREDRIRTWIRKMLNEWETELRERSDAERRTAEGKMVTAQHRQTRKYLRPLLRKLKLRELEEDVLIRLLAMVENCESKEYRQAHDKYIELAIGNAAWPMGVTMVGIHERAGRSKIFSSEIAHILNDETTRKYIQMFKRLMSFCQRRYPSDPSQMVEMSTTHV